MAAAQRGVSVAGMTTTGTARALRFRDRHDAGRRLATAVEHLRAERPLVVGLPRGGVEVAYEVAAALDAPLDVVIVRKLGLPFQPEYAIGAVGEEGVVLANSEALELFGLRGDPLAAIVAREREELERRAARYRVGRAPLPVAGRTVILVDDGVATGSTAQAAARVLRQRGAARIVLAVPVGPPDVRARFADTVDDVVCLECPSDFFAVGQAFADFAQTSDEEVLELLRLARQREVGDDTDPAPPVASRGDDRASGGLDLSRVAHHDVRIPVGRAEVEGTIAIPPRPRGLALFAHGSGSSRRSPRNVQVASTLHGAGLATLLFDLLSDDEARDRTNVFDVALLGARLVAATRFAASQPVVAELPVGYCGASTGAAAALHAAAETDSDVRAIVSRGGRPDLAAHRLGAVRAPTLLIVGGDDLEVLALNRRAAAQLRCPHRIVVVQGATHLFTEPGALEHVARLAADWFGEHLVAALPA
jgi:putative phosphoribosyl transferase